jgi:GntR family transcriptional regulator
VEQFKRDPLYVQVHDRLLHMIQDGAFKIGQQLPSEAELSASLGISRPTLREALRALEQRGLIVRRHGLGTFVARSEPLRSGLEKLESILSLANSQGLPTEVRNLTTEEGTAGETVSAQLQIALGSPVTIVRRTIMVAGTPISWMEDFVATSCLKPAEIDASFNGSVLDFLRQKQNLRIEKAVADITAVLASRVLAQLLEVPPGAALVLIEETMVGPNGAPIDYAHNYSVPGRLGVRVIRS